MVTPSAGMPDRKGSSPHWRAAFASREFTMLQYARAGRTIAGEMISVAVGWQIYELLRSPAALGYAGLAEFLPGMLLFLWAGKLADRLDRRTILIACFGSSAVGSAMLAVVSVSHSAVATIYLLLALLGAMRTFAGPATLALAPQLVPAEHFPNAVAWASTVFTLSTILGPMLGGALYDLARGPAAVYVTATAVYVCALFATSRIRSRPCPQGEASGQTALAGLQYVWRNKAVLGCLSLDLTAVLFGGVVALLPIYAKDILHLGTWGLGLLRSASAIGAVVMALRIARHPLDNHAGAKMLASVALFGIATIIFGFSSHALISVAALLVIGAADMVSVIVRGSLIQLAVRPEMRGRVSAVNLLFTSASNQIGEFESGLTAQWLGAVPAVVFGGVATLLIVALWTWFFPEIREIQRLADITHSES